MNKETLEEAAEMYARTHTDTSVFRTTHIRDFIEGAKWQQKNSYSEEEVLEMLNCFSNEAFIKQWFEQFKKK